METLLIVDFCHFSSDSHWARPPVCITFNQTQLKLIFHECRLVISKCFFCQNSTYDQPTLEGHFAEELICQISFWGNSYWGGMFWCQRFWHGIFWRACSCCFYYVMPCPQQTIQKTAASSTTNLGMFVRNLGSSPHCLVRWHCQRLYLSIVLVHPSPHITTKQLPRLDRSR